MLFMLRIVPCTLQNTITDLFAKPSGLDSLIEEKQRADVQAYDQDSSSAAIAAPSVAPNLNEKQFEQVNDSRSH